MKSATEPDYCGQNQELAPRNGTGHVVFCGQALADGGGW